MTPDQLTQYLIQSPVEEGFLKSDIESDRMELLREKGILFLFCAHPFLYIEKLVNKLMKQYKFDKYFAVDITDFINELIMPRPEMVYVGASKNTPTSLLENIEKDLLKVNIHKDMKYTQLLEIINQEVFSKYSKKYNMLIVYSSTNFVDHSFSIVRKYPAIMINKGLVPTLTRRIPNIINLTIKDTLEKSKKFDRVFSTDISKGFTPIDTKDLTLYHVSRNENLDELTPKITTRPINDLENTRIPRISACDNVDACFRAVGATEGIWHVYQLILNNDSVVGKPKVYYVPDVEKTGEFWVLTPTKVKKIGKVKVTFDKEKNRYPYTVID